MSNASTALARRANGVFYTPPELARRLAEIALYPSEGSSAAAGECPNRILDPACGSGNLLLAVAVALHKRGLPWAEIVPRLHGVDIDADAVREARERIAAAARAGDERLSEPSRDEALRRTLRVNIVCADALEQPFALRSAAPSAASAPFDLIIANPPFGNAIDKRTARDDAQRTAYASAYPNAATGAYDKASLFVERALQLAAPDARVALILPRAMLAATYAARLRKYVDQAHQLSDLLRVPAADHFDAASVYVSALVIDAQPTHRRAEVRMWTLEEGPSGAGRPQDARWSVLLSPHAALIEAIPDAWVRLDSLATLQAGASTGEAYDFVPGISEAPSPGAWKLVTTGSIDPFVCLWGVRTTRYLKRDLLTPWLARSVVSARRAALYDRPKVLVAGLSKILEAVVDEGGTCAGAVATLALTVEGDDLAQLKALCAYLNSDLARAQYQALHGAQALGGGSVQVTKRKLGELRLPANFAQVSDWSALAASLGGPV